jgi:folate-binding protein YgfZ
MTKQQNMNINKPHQIINLDDLTVLFVTGKDATKFLHAQFTNDLASLPVNSWQYSGYCTPKGRLLAFMTIARINDNEYLLILPAEVCESILPRLRMFVMRDDVTISPQHEQLHIAGIVSAADVLSDNGLVTEKATGKLVALDNTYMLTINEEMGRYLYIADPERIDRLPLDLADRNNWTQLDIQAGVPAIVTATLEAFVPQMVNLDLIGAVNFKKGCYPGQEVVARVHYLGKIKQRMFVATTTAIKPAKPGDKIYIAEQKDKLAGTVVQASNMNSGQILQLVLQTEAVSGNADFRLGDIDGDKVIVGTQPYTIIDTENQQ